ncbi:MAG: FliM/FliN family flagellar motor switch protein [Archangium sp.]|nr:FliM/FliN family flagellar motor switch protein [Archangium sp.]
MAGVVLNQDEISALMSAVQDGRVMPEAPKGRGTATPYDLTSQDRVIRGQMPTLDAINEQIGSSFAIGLAGRTRLSVRVSCGPASLLKFGDFNSLLAPPTTVCVMTLGKPGQQALLVLEPGLADALIAAALGDKRGRAEDQAQAPADDGPRRDFTNVERKVLTKLLSMFTEGMTQAWAPVLAFRPEIARFESDPRLAVIAPANEAAVLCSFELEGALKGVIQLALPYTAIEPAKKALMSPPKLGNTSDARFARRLEEELNQTQVELRALLGKTTLTLRDLLDLEDGAVLTLGTSEGVPLPLYVQGRAKFTGQPRVVGGALALEIDRGPVSEIRRPFSAEPEDEKKAA